MRMLQEGVAPALIENAAKFAGFPLAQGLTNLLPSWTGGPLSLIETVGLPKFLAECRRMAERYGTRFTPSPWLTQRAERGEAFYPS